jgi:hypothetical protein
MKILGTRSQKIGSKLICWATSETFSHVALELSSGFIIHSTRQGVNIQWAKHFREEHEVVIEAQFMGFMGEPRGLIEQLMEAVGRPYDFLLFLAMSLQRLDIPVPNWNRPNAFLCTELIAQYIMGSKDKLTPGQLFDRLSVLPTWEVRHLN